MFLVFLWKYFDFTEYKKPKFKIHFFYNLSEKFETENENKFERDLLQKVKRKLLIFEKLKFFYFIDPQLIPKQF